MAVKDLPRTSWLTYFVVGLSLLQVHRSSAQCYYTATPIPGVGSWTTFATAINNHGEVVGYVRNGGESSRAFFWSAATGTQLLSMPPGVTEMAATDINEAGQIVGWMRTPSYFRVAFTWD